MEQRPLAKVDVLGKSLGEDLERLGDGGGPWGDLVRAFYALVVADGIEAVDRRKASST